MKLTMCAAGALMAAVASLGGNAMANEGPPVGPVILNLDGTPLPTGYQEYTTTFTASTASDFITFALRDDPAYLFLDNVSVTLAGGGPNLLTNGDFEEGRVGASAPTGWTYLNTYGAASGGQVVSGAGVGGGNAYVDGAVQAYDAITQDITTTVGATYTVTFYLSEDNLSGDTNFSALSTNGDITDTDGNGINVVVYAGNIPTGVPEPATWAMMLTGFAAVGFGMRLRGRKSALASA